MSRYKGRLFTFGCSFTKYSWPTWANMLGKEFEEHYNYGMCGGGNLFIACSLGEAIVRHNINPDDTVIIMWTNVAREDRYVQGQWLPTGNVFTSDTYPKEFIKKFVDLRGSYIRDLAQIKLVDNILQFIGCKYEFLSMVDIRNFDQYSKTNILNDTIDVFDFYQTTIDKIKPSIFDTIFNHDWHSGKVLYESESSTPVRRFDTHSLPIEHIEYLNKVLPEYQISGETIKAATEITAYIISKFAYLQKNKIKDWDYWQNTIIPDIENFCNSKFTNNDSARRRL